MSVEWTYKLVKEAGMKRLVASVFLIVAMCYAAWTADQAVAFAQDDTGDAAVLQADTALQIALKKKDVKSLGALLDQQFSWTSETGQILTSTQFLKDAATGNVVGDTEYNNAKSQSYGQLAIVSGVGKRTGHEGTFYARVWVKRTAGWLLLTHQDTPILGKGTPSLPMVSVKGAPSIADCENPCRTLPYTPKTAEQKEIVKAYQAVEIAVATHDDKTWAHYVADEFVGIGRRYLGTPDTKAGRVGQIGITTNHVIVPKMLWGETLVFGNAAIMLAEHQPMGEPPYHVIRVYVNRDGRWQLAHRQETTIKGTPPARDKLS